MSRKEPVYEFVTPWTPKKPAYVDKLKRWQDDDLRSESLERDLTAHARLSELLGDASSADPSSVRRQFEDLADLGYAGYFYCDFARIAMRDLIKAYQGLSMDYVRDPNFKTYYEWNWLQSLLDDAEPGRASQARVLFKNPADPEDPTLFGKLMFFDTKYRVDADQTEVYLQESVATEFATYHTEHRVFGVSSRDLLILSCLDMINLLAPRPEWAALPRRIAYFRGYRDAGTGRVFPHPLYPQVGLLVGRFWINTDTSLGLDIDTGYDDLRVGISLGGERAGGTSSRHTVAKK